MVVEDSTIIRVLISKWLDEEADLSVVARCRNGLQAVTEIARVQPDVVVLDIEMPEMDGMTALPKLIEACPKVQVIMASTLTKRNAEISLKAMSLGAADYIPKPETNNGVRSSEDFRRALVDRARALGRAGRSGSVIRSPAASSGGAPTIELRDPAHKPSEIIAIGSSTGGPQALNRVMADIGQETDLPIIIAQHMPKMFTAILAEHITKASGRQAAEGRDGEAIVPGRVYVAPGDYHMVLAEVDGRKVIRLNQNPPVNFCRPAVDPMFDTVAKLYGDRALAVVLTGMGADGAEGGLAIANANGCVIAQDEASSVVWGMPGATAEIGACVSVTPLEQIGSEILRRIKGATR